MIEWLKKHFDDIIQGFFILIGFTLVMGIIYLEAKESDRIQETRRIKQIEDSKWEYIGQDTYRLKTETGYIYRTKEGVVK